MGILDDKVAIVTGGGRGLGRAHCLALAEAGATVVVNDLGSGVHGEQTGDSPADEVVAEITKLGGRAVANHASVTDWAATEAHGRGHGRGVRPPRHRGEQRRASCATACCSR